MTSSSRSTDHHGSPSSMPQFFTSSIFDSADDDDFQVPLTQTETPNNPSAQEPLRPFYCSFPTRASNKPKSSYVTAIGDENIPSGSIQNTGFHSHSSRTAIGDASRSSDLFNNPLDDKDEYDLSDGHSDYSLDSIQPSIVDCSYAVLDEHDREETVNEYGDYSSTCDEKKGLKINKGYMCHSIESRLIKSRVEPVMNFDESGLGESMNGDFEHSEKLNVLLKLCYEVEEEDSLVDGAISVQCPLCGVDISDLSDEQRQVHTNDCLDKGDTDAQDVVLPDDDRGVAVHGQVVDDSRFFPVLKWLRNIGLSRYEDAFVREEIDWDALQWLTDEDLINIGITALGPRKKIVHALSELRKGTARAVELCMDSDVSGELGARTSYASEKQNNTSGGAVDETSKLPANKLITDYFPGFATNTKKACTTSSGQQGVGKKGTDSGRKSIMHKSNATKGRKLRDIPLWCCIPGTPFRVDAFRYLRGDCSHWFLTHFHMDHYQGLTRSFCHGKIYCSSITARLVNMKIGIPLERLQVVPLDQKINIAGVDVTCLDANHCPGSIIILFEPPNGKAVLHTGDFRFYEQMASLPVLQTCQIHTLILDTTYCNPQYDFPKQDAVIQFVIDAVQAESFNPKTLFLIGSYTIGKERLFLEVARVLRKKVYVTSAKLRILKCLGFPEEDMQWFTLNEQESHIHVVPMWTLASFKRLKHVSNQYAGRYSLIVAFSPTGWTYGKGKKKSPGRKWQQGTIIRYEVPYSEHSSFTELKEFVKIVSPEKIIPSVNNDGPDSASSMISLLLA